MDCWGKCVAAEPLFPLRRSARDWSKELIWTPTSEQQFRKLHLHFSSRRSQLPAETQLLYRCCLSSPVPLQGSDGKGQSKSFLTPRSPPRLSAGI